LNIRLAPRTAAASFSPNSQGLGGGGSSGHRTVSLARSSPALGAEARSEACTCGLEGIGTRQGDGDFASKGESALPGKYPWMAAVVFKDSYSGHMTIGDCGATLVASKWAVTAAHCYFNCKLAPTGSACRLEEDHHFTIPAIVLGEHDLRDKWSPDEPNWEFIEVYQIHLHENYDRVSRRYDIALIEFDRAVDLTKYTPACLPGPTPENDNFLGEWLTACGWGRIDSCSPVTSKILQEVRVRAVSDEDCRQSRGSYNHYNEDENRCVQEYSSYEDLIFPESLCASGSAGSDTCRGDSGGPLTYKTDHGHHFLVGVTSFGFGCGQANFPGVYVDVGHPQIASWMKEIRNLQDIECTAQQKKTK